MRRTFYGWAIGTMAVGLWAGPVSAAPTPSSSATPSSNVAVSPGTVTVDKSQGIVTFGVVNTGDVPISTKVGASFDGKQVLGASASVSGVGQDVQCTTLFADAPSTPPGVDPPIIGGSSVMVDCGPFSPPSGTTAIVTLLVSLTPGALDVPVKLASTADDDDPSDDEATLLASSAEPAVTTTTTTVAPSTTTTPSSVPTGLLPATGSTTSTLAAVAAGLLVAGASLIVRSRRGVDAPTR